jgi:hypothetical protein
LTRPESEALAESGAEVRVGVGRARKGQRQHDDRCGEPGHARPPFRCRPGALRALQKVRSRSTRKIARKLSGLLRGRPSRPALPTGLGRSPGRRGPVHRPTTAGCAKRPRGRTVGGPGSPRGSSDRHIVESTFRDASLPATVPQVGARASPRPARRDGSWRGGPRAGRAAARHRP